MPEPQNIEPLNLPSRVLIMDDEPRIRTKFRDQLKKGHLLARVARSPKHLTRLVESDRYDASVLDIRMSSGGNEGLAVVRQLRKQYPEMYIEVHTGYAEYEKLAYDMGADVVFLKPDGYGVDAPERIKKGILEKKKGMIKRKLSILAAVAGTDLEEIIDLSDDLRIESAALRIDILVESFVHMKSYLEAHGKDYGLSKKKVEAMKADVAKVLAKLISNKPESS